MKQICLIVFLTFALLPAYGVPIVENQVEGETLVGATENANDIAVKPIVLDDVPEDATETDTEDVTPTTEEAAEDGVSVIEVVDSITQSDDFVEADLPKQAEQVLPTEEEQTAESPAEQEYADDAEIDDDIEAAAFIEEEEDALDLADDDSEGDYELGEIFDGSEQIPLNPNATEDPSAAAVETAESTEEPILILTPVNPPTESPTVDEKDAEDSKNAEESAAMRISLVSVAAVILLTFL